MFQTFSGSSRRPRQVNLSGQNLNPFAASSWTPSASGTQQTVAHAQQERQQRQQEREKLNASKRIQRTWRGHKTRKELADSRRRTWDEIEVGKSGVANSESTLVEQLQLLVAFFNPRRRDDIQRLVTLSGRIFVVGYETFLCRQDVQPQLLRLANVSLDALQRSVKSCNLASWHHFNIKLEFMTNGLHSSLPNCSASLLRLLIVIIDRRPEVFRRISKKYYSFLSAILSSHGTVDVEKNLTITAIRTPLVEHIEFDQNGKNYSLPKQVLFYLSTSNQH